MAYFKTLSPHFHERPEKIHRRTTVCDMCVTIYIRSYPPYLSQSSPSTTRGCAVKWRQGALFYIEINFYANMKLCIFFNNRNRNNSHLHYAAQTNTDHCCKPIDTNKSHKLSLYFVKHSPYRKKIQIQVSYLISVYNLYYVQICCITRLF